MLLPVQQMVDFGLINDPSKIAEVSITIHNRNQTSVEVVEASSSPKHSSITVIPRAGPESSPLVISGGETADVATAAFSGALEGTFHGKIIVTTRETIAPVGPTKKSTVGLNPAEPTKQTMQLSKVELPYVARVFHGALSWRMNTTNFSPQTAGVSYPVRIFTFTHSFRVPVCFIEARMDDNIFIIDTFKKGAVLHPGESLEVLRMVFNPNGSSGHQYQTRLHVTTNASSISMPLIFFHGHLSYNIIRPSQEIAGALNSGTSTSPISLDFGAIAVGESSTVRMLVRIG